MAVFPCWKNKWKDIISKLLINKVWKGKATDGKELKLIRTEKGLALTDGELSLRADFSELKKRLHKNNLSRELLVKAARLKRRPAGGTDKAAFGELPLLLDATAGFGEDSFLLAAAGFRVLLFEKDPVIAALLRDALERAGESADPAVSEPAGRMELREEDSISYMRELLEKTPENIRPGGGADPSLSRPDVIFLDPMFPERKKSGLIGKKFQLLQQLEHPCENETELLEAAFSLCPKKLIVKRPLKGPYLAGIKPDYSLSGKAIRVDCFVSPSRIRRSVSDRKP